MPEWEELHKTLWAREPDKRLKEFAKDYLKPGMRVLDLGCGKGRHTLYCAQMGVEVHGVDVSETALNALRDKAEKGQLFELVKVAKADMGELPYPDSYFDAVITVNAVNHGHWKDVKRFFSEATRVLKSGGMLFVLCAPLEFLEDTRTPETKELERGTFIDIDTMDGDVPHHLFTKEEMRELLEGYDIIELDNFRRFSDFLKKEVNRMEVTARKR